MLANVTNLFGFLGGLGMFLYGMHLMADGMQKTAGGRMQKFLGMLTSSHFKAVGLGAIITAIIQSSGATTVMVVGFVSAGIMTLTQAVGVIMGANIGTTITAWIVSISQIGDAFKLAQPEFYAPFMIGIGALLACFSKSERKKTVGNIVLGLGLLFLGLKGMSASIKPYTSLPIFSQAFALLGGNPILGMIVGALVTALLQSSSASVGILQTLALNGVVTKSAAIYITLGQNIGSCVTALISSIGASKTAKRAAVIHLLFNVIGAIVFGFISFIIFSINKSFAASSIDSVQISIFHTIFNISNTLLLTPFVKQLIYISGVIVGEEKGNDADGEEILTHLDERIFGSPALALETAKVEVLHMGEVSLKSVKAAIEAAIDIDKDKMDFVYKNEKKINEMQSKLTEYLIKIDNLSLNEKQKEELSGLYYSINDIERVGDHAENIAENVGYLIDRELNFSDTAIEDLRKIGDMSYNAIKLAIKAREKGDLSLVRQVNQFEDDVDFLEDELREKHIDRLVKRECVPEAGIIFIDIMSNLERISDHATNLAEYVVKEL